MSDIEILSPEAFAPTESHPLARPVSSFSGARLGIRRDDTWHSFEIFAEEVDRLSRQHLRVSDVVHFDPEARIGTPEQESSRVEAFAKEVDAAIVGLGT